MDDDEAELLLTVTEEFKVSKQQEGIDWESVKSKCADIFELFRNELPSITEEASSLLKDYPHAKDRSIDHKIEEYSPKVQAGCRLRAKKWARKSGDAIL